MDPEKMAITGIVLVVVIVGLAIGVSFFAFEPNGGGSGNDTTLTGIVADRDLLELDLQLPSSWQFDMADGSTLTMSELDGKIILVDLMATWCSSCASQNEYLETIYETLGGPLEILSLTVDHSETAQMMADYQNDRGLH